MYPTTGNTRIGPDYKLRKQQPTDQYHVPPQPFEVSMYAKITQIGGMKKAVFTSPSAIYFLQR